MKKYFTLERTTSIVFTAVIYWVGAFIILPEWGAARILVMGLIIALTTDAIDQFFKARLAKKQAKKKSRLASSTSEENTP